jgi:hypothetical protein
VSGLRALPLVLILTTSSTYAFAGIRPATKLTCFPIRSGDTAAGLAQQLTGNMYNRRQPWFQIVDPATATFIPKSRYDDIEPGWRVCVSAQMLRPLSTQPRYVVASSAPVAVPTTGVTRRATAIDLTDLWWAVPLCVAVSGVGLAWAWKSLDERRARLDILSGFCHRFIHEFERPLLRNAVTRPVRSRVRFAPRRLRAEILIAPGSGRTYPNLVDHRRNVEYDVERVMRLLRDESFVRDSLHAEGQWVVIPCRFETDGQQEGAP